MRAAEVAFGPGLNVLYGPNDLGKSSLAMAIRAALLLPHRSNAALEFVPWGTDETPEVELVFHVQPDPRFWRVRKTFATGAGGSATLEVSPDDHSYALEAKGRQVDGELRRLLRWGIAEPGGRGGPRGLPDSFLTGALLAKQSETERIFAASLADDSDESGKKLLSHALQALAQDPLLKKALDVAQAKVDEAFTGNGRKRTGRQDPFRITGDEIKSAQAEYDKCRSELRETEDVEFQVRELSDELLSDQSAAKEAREHLQRCKVAWQQQLDRREAQNALGVARNKLDAIEDNLRAVTKGEAKESRLAVELQEAEERVTKLAGRHDSAQEKLESARAASRRLGADAEARIAKRQREIGELERRKLELQADLEAARTLGQQAESARDLEAAAAGRQKRVGGLTEQIKAADVELDRWKRAESTAKAGLRQLDGVAAFERWRRADAEAAKAEESRGKAIEERRTAEEWRKKADAIEADLAKRTLPSSGALPTIRALFGKLEFAKAALDVGLSVSIRLGQPRDLQVATDEGETQLESDVSGERRFEADRRVGLTVGEDVEVEVIGGKADAREAAQAAHDEWTAKGLPILAAAGVTSVEELDEACGQAAKAGETLATYHRDATACDARAAELEEVGSRASSLAARAAEREAELAEFDRPAIETLAGQLGADREAELAAWRREASKQADEAEDNRQRQDVALAQLQTELALAKSRLKADTESRDEALTKLGKPWQNVLGDAQKRQESLTAEIASIDPAIEKLGAEKDSEDEAAQDGVKAAEEELGAIKKEQVEALAAKESAVRALAATRGELGEKRKQAAGSDVDAAREEVKRKQAALDELGAPESPVTEEDLAKARENSASAEERVKERTDALRKLEGALEQVGGTVAKERASMAKEALQQARDREADLELDYEAWRLLRDTLREVENQESSHLGRALIGPITEKFSELTQGRYGDIEIEPELVTKGIHATGDTREIADLSTGVREQLATIFRISVAEHLESLLVLDDQLTQTDDRRMPWFREVLQDCATRSQIVVLTYEPDDYLEPEEFVGGSDSIRDSREGLVRAVDLERLVERAGSAKGIQHDV